MDNEDKALCFNCEGYFDVDDLRSHLDKFVCVDCSCYCEGCRDLIIKQDSIYFEGRGEFYCTECAIVCERCNDGETRDDCRTVGDETWCESCA